MFERLLSEVQAVQKPHGFKFKNPLYSIDSTTIELCAELFPCADYLEKKGGIKLTVKLDHQGKIPCFAVESNARNYQPSRAGFVKHS